MKAPFILVLDAGSSWLRGALYDAEAHPVEATRVRIASQPAALACANAVVLAEELATLIDRVLLAAGTGADRVAAVGMAHLASSCVGVDGEGAAVTPFYSYADNGPADDVAALRRRLDEPAVHRRTGCRLHSSYLPARLVWLKRLRPDEYARAVRWLALGAFFYGRLFGATRTSYSVASWSGLLNRQSQRWDAEWCRELELSEKHLGSLGEEPLLGLRPEFAARWPALAKVPWYPAIADGAASNLGTGCTDPARVALSLATSSAVRVALPDGPSASAALELPLALWSYRLDHRRGLVGGALTEGGGALAWARNTLALPPAAELASGRGFGPPDAHGLTVLPFWAGERSPGWHDDLRAAILGLGAATRALDIFQATMESVAYRVAGLFEAVQAVVPPITRLCASGGAALHYPHLVQIVADVLGRELELCTEAETTSRGTALAVLAALGNSAPTGTPGTTIRPNPDHHSHYRAAMQRQARWYALCVDQGAQPP